LRIAFKYYDGQIYREPLGVQANKNTRADARRLGSTIQLELSAHSFDYALRFPNSKRLEALGLRNSITTGLAASMTVTSFIESVWLPSKQGAVKESTLCYYREVAVPLIGRSPIGEKSLSALTPESVDEWRNWINERKKGNGAPLSARRKNMALDVLSQMIELARERKRIQEDLLVGVRSFKDDGQIQPIEEDDFADTDEDNEEANPYTPEEIEKLIAAAGGWERALLTLYFFTGVRRGEALALTWPKVYLDRDCALINRTLTARHGITTPKTKSSRRIVQFGPRVRNELIQQRQRVQLRSRFVFPNQQGEKINVRWATDTVWRRIVEKAEVSHRSIGQCRHSFAVVALKQRKPLNWIQRQMGHTTLQMLFKHYLRWIPTEDLPPEELVTLENPASNQPHPNPTRANLGTEQDR
jgi:integrase